MPADFEMAPSAYHLGTCNALVKGVDGQVRQCGQPAVERRLGGGFAGTENDWRRCAEHARDRQQAGL
jgi:hypothetical protein